MSEVIPNTMTHHAKAVASFQPERNQVTLNDDSTLTYDYLVVAPGLKINYAGVTGLEKALADPNSGVSTIYGKGSAVKAWENIKSLKQVRRTDGLLCLECVCSDELDNNTTGHGHLHTTRWTCQVRRRTTEGAVDG